MSISSSYLFDSSPKRVGIIGAGVAGSTIAMHLSQHPELQVVLMEQGPSLVNGPPFCHLHAGGNLYREIDDKQCIQLLKESIETLKLYPFSVNLRPTVIVVPMRDPQEPTDLLPRLACLQQEYQQLVEQDLANQLLGEPADYYRCYDEATMRQLAQQPLPAKAESADDWMIPLAKELDFSTVKWPLIQVQEYGLSLFRLAAQVDLALTQRSNCTIYLNQAVTNVTADGEGWLIHRGQETPVKVDYLVNACGYRTGQLDDLLAINSERMVEFKAAYVTQWPQDGHWPEVIFHGERGTPNGMAQLTPYADGLFQLHGMTENITLFKEGLAASTPASAQPNLPPELQAILDKGWPSEVRAHRTQQAINHMAYFLPAFQQAQDAGKPLFGAQQIPGNDVTLRAASVAFAERCYARAEIVKATSALPVAMAIEEQLQQLGLLDGGICRQATELTYHEVEERAAELARQRQYPKGLARRVRLPAETV